MPLIGQYKLSGVDVWAWKITETLDELLEAVPAECASFAIEKFASKKRCAEWLAVRAIVKQQLGYDVRIVYDAAGKPSLDGACGYISISHTKGYAVVAFSREEEIGVDVELVSRNVVSVAGRFMPEGLLADILPAEKNNMALLHWCAKEGLYKIVGNLGGDFKDNISVDVVELGERGCASLALVGLEYRGGKNYLADYFVLGDILVVLCRKKVSR